MYKTILLKLSGEAMGNEQGPFDFDFLNALSLQIKTLAEDGIGIGIVVGGGNICRGRIFEQLGLDREKSDYIGMEATVMNAQTLEAALLKNGVKAKALSAIEVQNVENYSSERAKELIAAGVVAVFGGGTGKPFFSTDTASAIRASEIEADVILMAKNGTDGVYDKDPNKYNDAVRFDEMKFDDIIDMKLGVIDLAAAEICRDHKIKAFVFDMAEPDNIIKAARSEAVGTLIK